MPQMMGDANVIWPSIAPPVVANPSGPVNSVAGFNVTVGPFVSSSAAPLLSTDWEIRTAPNGGGSLVYSSAPDLVSLLLKTVPIGAISGLLTGQTYYIRVRFNTSAGSSAFSADAVITT